MTKKTNNVKQIKYGGKRSGGRGNKNSINSNNIVNINNNNIINSNEYNNNNNSISNSTGVRTPIIGGSKGKRNKKMKMSALVGDRPSVVPLSKSNCLLFYLYRDLRNDLYSTIQSSSH